ncbi:DUF1648 domain-containing protein [Sediminibacterium roseum]|uniref:DUF1648 domain-containing protein n=1 Tax=Sediminibacterium roseum TaxID=1978412 RepID=A0ABW9ZS21_9BACT|nr:SdpI family protein [Sediminibacterium roseum]NCI48537.1 DUF1648 domain-containing protein [Sediminibacterium roseum]
MKKFSTMATLLVLLIVAIPLVYAAIIYPGLPHTIPIHFGANGKPDGFGSKDNLWFSTGLLCVVALGVYFLMSALPKIDPKNKAGRSPDVYRKIAFVVVIFLTGINVTIVSSMKGDTLALNHFLLPLMGLFFAVLGNYMHSIKPNYFVGFRTPWTLESEDNWRKTHQLVSKIWVPGGLLITIATFFLPMELGIFVLLIVLIPMIAIPAVFSYRYYKKHGV